MSTETLNILITSVGEQLPLTKEIIKEMMETSPGRKVYTCDMNPESASCVVDSDGCFKVTICTSEDYVETIWSLCIGHNIGMSLLRQKKMLSSCQRIRTCFGNMGCKQSFRSSHEILEYA